MNLLKKIATSFALFTFSTSMAFGQASNPKQIGDWIYADTTDAMSDRHGGIAMTVDSVSNAVLSVACRISMKENPILFILKYPKSQRVYEKYIRIYLRPDDGEVASMQWYSNPEEAMIYSGPDMRKFYKTIASAKIVKVRVMRENESYFDFDLKIDQAKEAIDRVYSECGRKPLLAP